MYHIKTEQHNVSRWYQAENHWDAMELFNALTKTYRFVQVWHGADLLSEYKN